MSSVDKKFTEGLYQNILQIKTFYDKETTKYPIRRHPGHDQIHRLDAYGAMINKYIKKGGVNYHNIDQLIKYNKAVDTQNIYTKKVGKKEVEWENSEPSRKAMEKFTQMIMKNDLRKLEYFRSMTKINPYGDMKIKDIMALPVPMVREGTIEDAKNLKRNITNVVKRLEQTSKSNHKDSKEMTQLKEALDKLNKTLHSKGVSREVIGKQLEDLNKATMGYIKAKGVGKQVTKEGQMRMDIALDLCGISGDFMDVFASKERMKQIEANEKKFLDKNKFLNMNNKHIKNVSKNGILGFMKDDLSKYSQEKVKTEKVKTEKVKTEKVKTEKVLEADFSL